METKIKKRAVIYGLVAILLVTVITAISYDIAVYHAPTQLAFLKTFTSEAELKSFLDVNSKIKGPMYFLSPSDVNTFARSGGFLAQSSSESVSTPSFTFEYSGTNVQVEGVDEADTVKTDGEYIYTLSGNNVTIVDAHLPTHAQVVSKIALNGLYPQGIFVAGASLAVIGSKYSIPYIMPQVVYYPYSVNSKTFMNVYNVQDKANPKLLRNLTLTGSYFDSRMIGKYIYFVVSQPTYDVNETVFLPKLCSDDQETSVNATDIYYRSSFDQYYQFSTFAAVNIENATEAPNYKTVMLGGTSAMYVSLENMYATFSDWNGQTSVYRFGLDGRNITGEASGEIPGTILNQFSMDEYNGYFRVVATWGGLDFRVPTGSTTNENLRQTSVYVMDMDLTIVGRLDGLGVNENFHSARFMGDKCYLVTFQKTDPLFVINLADPRHPAILGELKIPGYSDYLHPYDETHIIGVGKQTQAAEEGYFSWYQGIKVSLFDVGNVTDPKQMDYYVIGDRGSSSPILDDHKAFLFDKSRNLMVIPVTVAKIDPTQFPESEPPSWAYGTPVWQGVYVFNVTLTDGLVLRGNITHIEGPYTSNSGLEIERALYISNVLYTVSDKKVKMNSLDDLSLIGEINLS